MTTLGAFLDILSANSTAGVTLMLPDRSFVPAWFHVTEVGRVQKDFIDCGGTVRSTAACVLQSWVAEDTHHRLDAGKLAHILQLAAPVLKSTDLPVEVEYQQQVVSQYPIEGVDVTPLGLLVRLGTKHTACLAADRCGVAAPAEGACCTTPGCC
jgi:hypothetical protein